MTAKKLKEIETRVQMLLFENAKLRADDYLLFAEYINKYYPRLAAIPLHEVLTNHFERGLPSFESVTRARRKAQERFPELYSERATISRKKQEAAYIEYARA